MLFKNNRVCILNIHFMYFNIRIRQTYLGVVEQLITENDNFQQVARENCGGVNTYSNVKCEDIVTYMVSRKLARLINHRITPFTAYCGITVYLFWMSVMY